MLRTLTATEIAAHADGILSIAADQPGEYWTLDNFLADLPEKWSLSFAAWEGDKPVAYAILSRKSPERVHLHHFMIAPPYRGAGLGGRMIAEMERRAAAAGARDFTLKAEAGNARARALYARHGFEERGTERAYVLLGKAAAPRRRAVGIHQPNYLPWLGYFHKIALVDTFVFFDTVQMPIGKSFVSRNRIKTVAGELWLTVPTARDSDGKPIAETRIVPGNWPRKHLKSIETAYARASELKPILALVRDAIGDGTGSIADLNVRLVAAIARHLGFGGVSFLRAIEMGLEGDGAETIGEILARTEATTYVTGAGAGTERSIDPEALGARGIDVRYLAKSYPAYPQRHGAFLPNLSILDAVLNCGVEGTRALLAAAD